MTEKNQAERFLEELEDNKATRSSAMKELQELDDPSWTLVLELTPRIAYYATEGNRLEEKRAGEILKRFARVQPSAVAQGFTEADNFIPEDNEKAAKDIMTALFEVEEENPGILAGEKADLSGFLRSRSDDIRHDAAKLLGYFATRNAVNRLDRLRNERGADKVLYRGASIGLETAAERVITSLEETGPLPQEEAVKTLEALAEADPDLLVDHCVSLLKGLQTEYHDRVTDVVVKIVDSQTGNRQDSTACDIADEALDLYDEHVSNSETTVVEMCKRSSEATQHIADQLPTTELDNQNFLSPSVDTISGRLVASLADERYRRIAASGLDRRIRADDIDLSPLLESLVALMSHDTAGRSAAKLAGRIATEDPPTTLEVYDQRIRETLLAEVEAHNEQYFRRILIFLRSCADSHETLAEPVVHDVVDQILTVLDNIPEEVATVLECASRTVPGEVAQRASPISALLNARDSDVRKKGVAILGTVLDSEGVCLPDVLDRLLRALDDPNSKVRATAIKAVEETGMYPAPPKLRDMAADDSVTEEIRARAKQAVSNIEAQKLDFEIHGEELDEERGDFLTGDADSIELRYWDCSFGWTPVNFGSLRDSLYETIRKRREAKSGSNIPVLLPYFEPKEAVLLAIDTVLQQIKDGQKVVLFSPGTQTQWGQKSEVRRELSRYGIAPKGAGNFQAIPLPEIVPHAYISQGKMKTRIDGSTSARIVLTKNLGEILTLDSADVDSLVLNLSARTKSEWAEQLERIDDQFPGTTSTTIYSPFTKNEVEKGRPVYKPPEFLTDVNTLPDVDTLESVLEGSSTDDVGGKFTTEKNKNSEHIDSAPEEALYIQNRQRATEGPSNQTIRSDYDIRSLAEGSDIRITEIDAPEIRSLLQQVFKLSAELEDVDDRGGAHRIFGEQMFFERLPVPVRHHDEWIREQWDAGEYMLPKVSRERLENLKTFGSQVEKLAVVQPVNEAEQQLQRIRDALTNKNPLFDSISERVQQAVENRESLAVLVPTPSWAGMVRRAFEHEINLDFDDRTDDLVSVETPDTLREKDRLESLVIPGPLHPQHSGYYVYPRAKTIEVLTYDRRWAGMIERHASEYIALLNATAARKEFEPFTEPNLVGDTEPIRDKIDDEKETVGEPTVGPASRTSQSAVTNHEGYSEGTLDLLARAMERTSNTEYAESASRYEREYRSYEIQLDKDIALHLSNHERVLRKKRGAESGENGFHWVSAEVLSRGDHIVYLPSDVEKELWHDHLHNLYDEELEMTAVNDLETWYETIGSIWREVENIYHSNMDGDVIDIVYRKCRNEGLDRRKETLYSWFEAVREAEGPLDLVKDPSLTIGPRKADDIRAIGEAFDKEVLINNHDGIETAMQGFRTVNRQEGREFQKWMKDQFTDQDENEVKKNAEVHEVENVFELSE